MSYLNSRQVCAAFPITYSSLTKARTFGNGPKFLKVGRRVFYRTDDVREWLEANICASTSDYARH